MVKKIAIALLMILGADQNLLAHNGPDNGTLKIVIVRHGEKPPLGDNLNCKGLNRSTLLPAVIKAKFGVPDRLYVPSMAQSKSTGHSRMFQTITPLAVKYNLQINTTYPQNDFENIVNDLKSRTGTILLVWEHKNIAPLVRALGINTPKLKWPDDDFDSIWIITFPKGKPTLTRDVEGLNPVDDCSF